MPCLNVCSGLKVHVMSLFVRTPTENISWSTVLMRTVEALPALLFFLLLSAFKALLDGWSPLLSEHRQARKKLNVLPAA